VRAAAKTGTEQAIVVAIVDTTCPATPEPDQVKQDEYANLSRGSHGGSAKGFGSQDMLPDKDGHDAWNWLYRTVTGDRRG
jgi:hypothetical protein